jgi:hypothetical protein
MTERIRAILLVALSLAVGSACNQAAPTTDSSTANAAPGPTGTAGGGGTSGVPIDASAGGEATGSISAQITLPSGQKFDALLWTITGGGAVGPVQNGLVDVSKSLVAAFVVGNLPSATGYRIDLSATANDGSVVCGGTATFDVAPRATTPVAVAMACNVATGGAKVTRTDGSTYDCAAVASVTANPTEVTVGSSVTVSAKANGPDPASLSYSWTASSGSFDNPSSATAHFTCATQGVASLTLVAADGPVPSGASCSPALNTKALAVRCDPAVTAVPALPPWAMALLGLAVVGVGSLSASRRRSRLTA